MEIQNCNTIKSVEVGDIVYMKPTENARYWHPRQVLVTGVVTKVGRKYFSVNHGPDGIHARTEEKFSIDGAQCVNDGTYGYVLYSSKEDFERETIREQKLTEIRKYFEATRFRAKEPSYETVSGVYELLKREGLI